MKMTKKGIVSEKREEPWRRLTLFGNNVVETRKKRKERKEKRKKSKKKKPRNDYNPLYRQIYNMKKYGDSGA